MGAFISKGAWNRGGGWDSCHQSKISMPSSPYSQAAFSSSSVTAISSSGKQSLHLTQNKIPENISCQLISISAPRSNKSGGNYQAGVRSGLSQERKQPDLLCFFFNFLYLGLAGRYASNRPKNDSYPIRQLPLKRKKEAFGGHKPSGLDTWTPGSLPQGPSFGTARLPEDEGEERDDRDRVTGGGMK
uniref:Uncharacterized protein n=1 Tax=Solanum tuberosum TaxID=4113 RepID=M1DF60_SOLTU